MYLKKHLNFYLRMLILIAILLEFIFTSISLQNKIVAILLVLMTATIDTLSFGPTAQSDHETFNEYASYSI